MIKIDAVKFRVATLCASREETRYYLNGVYVEPHHERGALLTATDGHRLISIYDEAGECTKPAIIGMSKHLIAACVPAKGRGLETLWLSVDDAGIVSVGHYRGEKSGLIDGTYPEWKQIIPKKPEAKDGEEAPPQKWAPSNFNSKYLTDFGRIATELSDNGMHKLRLLPRGDDPALILFPDAPFAFGILMPMRASEAVDVPAYFAHPKKEEPAPEAPVTADPPAVNAPAPKAKAKVISIKRRTKKPARNLRRPAKKSAKPKRRAA